MTGLLVTGQLEPVKPLAVRSWFMRSGEGDLAALKTIGDAAAVPSWVKSGGGTIGSRRADLTDDDIEKCIRDYVWRLVNFTGTLQAGAPSTNRAADLHAYIVANPTLNSNKGPTMDCGSIMYLYIGLLAAYGIPARQTWCHRGSGNTSDVQAEYWSPEAGGWARTMPHTGERDIWNATGKGASMLDAVTVARQVGRTGIITQTAEGGGGAGYRSGVVQDLTLYSDHARWGRGNRLQFSGGQTGDPNYTEYGGNRSTYIRFLDPSASANAGTVTTAQASSVKARDTSDVAFTPSALMARGKINAQGLAEIVLDAFMLDGVSSYQVKTPGASTWTTLPNAGHTFYPVAGQSWQYRAVGPLGNTTQTVTVTVA